MLGRVIDLYAAEGHWDAIDRIITARDWANIDQVPWAQGEGCFRFHAEGPQHFGSFETVLGRIALRVLQERVRAGRRVIGLGFHFDLTVRRFGIDRVVRAIKQRAGKHTRPNVEQTATPIDSAVEHEHATA